jgi:hypothetical protein
LQTRSCRYPTPEVPAVKHNLQIIRGIFSILAIGQTPTR